MWPKIILLCKRIIFNLKYRNSTVIEIFHNVKNAAFSCPRGLLEIVGEGGKGKKLQLCKRKNKRAKQKAIFQTPPPPGWIAVYAPAYTI